MIDRRNRAGSPRGFTLVELLVAIAIIAILIGMLTVAASSVHKSMRKSRAETQIKVLADAIGKYADAWPAWTSNGQALSRKGWPHWSSGWAFQTNTGATRFTVELNFNDGNAGVLLEPLLLGNDDNTNAANFRDDVKIVGQCLAYQLTAATAGKPMLSDSDNAGIEVADPASGNVFYPVLAVGSPAKLARRVIMDPWGNPYRYLWLTRDHQTAAGWRAITSVFFPANYDPNNNPGPNDLTTVGPKFAVAEGFVIESAGPDGKFGNVWKRINRASPTPQDQADIDNAADNVRNKL